MILLLFLSCGGSEPLNQHLVSDRDQYMAAAQTADASAAAELCVQIERTDLQGECLLFTAQMAVQQRRDGLSICDKASTMAWKQACWFDVVDSAGLTGTRAMNICRQTGKFKSRCLYHALQREETSLMKQFSLGQEQELQKEIHNRMVSLQIEELQEDPISETLVSRIAARRFLQVQKKDPQVVFDSAFCGTAKTANCIDAYRFAIKMAGKGRLPKNCTLPMDRQRVVAAGLPSWADSFSASAQEAWQNLCSRQNNRNQKASDHHGSNTK